MISKIIISYPMSSTYVVSSSEGCMVIWRCFPDIDPCLTPSTYPCNRQNAEACVVSKLPLQSQCIPHDLFAIWTSPHVLKYIPRIMHMVCASMCFIVIWPPSVSPISYNHTMCAPNAQTWMFEHLRYILCINLLVPPRPFMPKGYCRCLRLYVCLSVRP